MDVCFASCLCGYSIVKFVHIDAVGGILLWRCQICGTKLFLRVSYPPTWWSHHLESHHSVVSHSVLFTIRWFHIQFFSLFGGFTFSSFNYSVVSHSVLFTIRLFHIQFFSLFGGFTFSSFHYSVVSHSVLFTIRWFHIQFFSLFGGFTFSSFHYSVVSHSVLFTITATLNNPSERAKHSIIFYNNSYQRTEKNFFITNNNTDSAQFLCHRDFRTSIRSS